MMEGLRNSPNRHYYTYFGILILIFICSNIFGCLINTTNFQDYVKIFFDNELEYNLTIEFLEYIVNKIFELSCDKIFKKLKSSEN